MKVEGVLGLLAMGRQTDRPTYVADAPRHGAFFARRRRLVGLAFDAQIHDVVTANGAVVDNDIPSPEGYGVPLDLDQLCSGTSIRVLTFLTSNRFLSPSELAPALATLALGAAGASVMFTSAMVQVYDRMWGCGGSCLQALDEQDAGIGRGLGVEVRRKHGGEYD